MVRDVAPDMVRIAITGYADLETAGRAINEGNIFRFLTKPCEKERLIAGLNAGLEQHRLINAEKELLEKTLRGTIHVLTGMLSLVNPAAFSRTTGIRHCVEYLVGRLHLRQTWRFEIAALLSLLGCVTLDPELVESYYAGQKLSPEDQARFDSHPSTAAGLLASIPRLEQISWIIAHQQLSAAQLLSVGAKQPPDVVTGTNILSLSIAYDRLICQGLAHRDALGVLRARKYQYNESLLDLLEEMRPGVDSMEVRACPVNELHCGMVLREEVRTRNGLLVVAKGQEISSALMLRLRNFYERRQISGSVLVMAPVQQPVSVS
jgi:hypothetical protein